MNLLPNHQQAIIPIEKLRDYCLNKEHPVGKHKAIVFYSALELILLDAETLQIQIQAKLARHEAIPTKKDEYGERFHVDMEISNFEKKA